MRRWRSCFLFAVLNAVVTSATLSEVPRLVGEIEERLFAKSEVRWQKEKSLITGTDHGGELWVDSEGNNIRGLRVIIGLSNEEIVREFYYEKGVMVFAVFLRKRHPWNSDTNEIDRSRVSGEIEDRYYFVGGKLRYWSTGRLSMAVADGKGFSEEEKIVKDESDFFLDVAKGQGKTIDIELFLKKKAAISAESEESGVK
jgi:hypothetical protein